MPICDINPDHGEMAIEPMFGKDDEILQYGYFCKVKDCDGYGGPVAGKPIKVHKPATEPIEQLPLFEKENPDNVET